MSVISLGFSLHLWGGGLFCSLFQLIRFFLYNLNLGLKNGEKIACHHLSFNIPNHD